VSNIERVFWTILGNAGIASFIPGGSIHRPAGRKAMRREIARFLDLRFLEYYRSWHPEGWREKRFYPYPIFAQFSLTRGRLLSILTLPKNNLLRSWNRGEAMTGPGLSAVHGSSNVSSHSYSLGKFRDQEPDDFIGLNTG